MLALFIVAIAVASSSADNSVPSQGLLVTKTKAAGMVWELSLDPESGVYHISLRNENADAEVFQDRFSERSGYDLIPAAVTMYVRVNGKAMPDLSHFYRDEGEGFRFDPYHNPSNFWVPGNNAREICGSCTMERSFHLRHFLDRILRRMSGFFAELRSRNVLSGKPELDSLARELDYLSDIRELEIKLTCGTIIWSREDLVLRVETGWITLPAEQYAREYLRSAALDD